MAVTKLLESAAAENVKQAGKEINVLKPCVNQISAVGTVNVLHPTNADVQENIPALSN